MKDIIAYFTKHVVIRYIIAGSTGAATDLTILYILNSLLKLQYLIAAILAFLVAFCVSFILHKYWTFKSHAEETHKQAMLYMLTSLFALGLNTLFMYIFVGHFHLAVILSQIFAGMLVAFSSFFISRTVVFKYKHEHHIS